jgi:hypothetical protein
MTTQTGGQLPETETQNWVFPLGIRIALIAIGTVAAFTRKQTI